MSGQREEGDDSEALGKSSLVSKASSSRPTQIKVYKSSDIYIQFMRGFTATEWVLLSDHEKIVSKLEKLNADLRTALGIKQTTNIRFAGGKQ